MWARNYWNTYKYESRTIRTLMNRNVYVNAHKRNCYLWMNNEWMNEAMPSIPRDVCEKSELCDNECKSIFVCTYIYVVYDSDMYILSGLCRCFFWRGSLWIYAATSGLCGCFFWTGTLWRHAVTYTFVRYKENMCVLCALACAYVHTQTLIVYVCMYTYVLT